MLVSNILEFWHKSGFQHGCKVYLSDYPDLHITHAEAQAAGGGEVGTGYCVYPEMNCHTFLFKTETAKATFSRRLNPSVTLP